MLTIRSAGNGSTSLPRAEVAKHPGSFLHNMTTDIAPDMNTDVDIDLTSLADSPLADWPGVALNISDIYW